MSDYYTGCHAACDCEIVPVQDDGGAAYPQPFIAVVAGHDNEVAIPCPGDIPTGMSLRDKFAIEAMASLIAKSPYIPCAAESDTPHIHFSVALGAYAYADAMLEARRQ